MKSITVSIEALVSKHNDHLGYVLKCIKDAQHHRQQFAVIGTSLWENIDPREYWHKVMHIKQYCDAHDIAFLALLNSSTDQYKFDSQDVDIEYVDYFLLRSWHYHLDNPGSARTAGAPILFIPGKPDKHHRAPLLAKFWLNEMLNKLHYSFYVDPGLESSTRRYLSNLDDARWQDFLRLQKTLDPINIVRMHGMHFSAFPFDTDLYARTSCSLISETCFDLRAVWITEKTWRAMIYQHPFVMAAVPNTLSRLRAKGFRTFETYLPYPDYDSISDMTDRLQKIYVNSLALQSNQSETIDRDVNHNYHCCEKLYAENIRRIRSRLQTIGVDKDPLAVIPLHDPLAEPALTRTYEELT